MPLVTASIIPSSTSLAQHMVSGAPPTNRPVIELGPGTGVFTAALLESGVQQESLVLVEVNPKFADQLRGKYPKATVINANAQALGCVQLPQADVVISGLPLLSIHNDYVVSILAQVFKQMCPDGVLIQFTYGVRCPINTSILQQLGLVAKRYRFVLRNFPPASVYHIRKQPDQA